MVGTEDFDNIVWRQEWTPEIKAAPITQKNSKDTLSISDLEMAALILGWMVLEVLKVPLRHSHIYMYSDNTPTLEWNEKWLQKHQK